MKVKCKKDDLVRGLQYTEKIAGTNPSLPILSCVFLSASNNSLILRTTNLELGIEVSIPAAVEKGGIVVVPAGTLSKTIAVEFDATVALVGKEGNMVVETKNTKTTIKGQDPDEFPKLPYVEGGEQTTVDSSVFSTGIHAVVYSASTTTIRPELSSVYVYPKSKELIFVATDSFRLAEKRIPIAKGGQFESVLIPFKNASEVARIAGTLDEDLSLTFNESQMGIAADNLYITSRTIDGAFPNYEQIIPKEGLTDAVVLKHDFIQMLKKGAVFTDSFSQVSFHVSPKKKMLSMSARNSDVGESFDSIPATLSGEDLDISFNLRYIADALPHIHSESIELMFAGPGKPLLMHGKGDPHFRYIVMPMNR